ncbi:MAG: hypothetical protein LV479_11790 [Methylacidiphilales bacterium]|nr:hypothetical protein [Candidatus Methylacidiphilales bacterium]
MSENNMPDSIAPAKIHPNSRDFGFVLIGVALGIGWGSALSYPCILVFVMVLALTGVWFINKSRGR